jgi:hypothetical protein
MAAAVMEEMNVPINDFYSLLVDKRDLARGDRFHWTAPHTSCWRIRWSNRCFASSVKMPARDNPIIRRQS